MKWRDAASAAPGDREVLVRAVAADRRELERAIEELKQVVRSRLHVGVRMQRRLWTWLPTAIGLGLLYARRRVPRPPSTDPSYERSPTMSTFTRIVRNLSSTLGGVSVNDVLYAAGLERRSSMASRIAAGIGVFGTGLLVGAGLGLVFAPRSGRELRQDIAERARDIRDKGMGVMRRQGNGAEHGEGEDVQETESPL